MVEGKIQKRIFIAAVFLICAFFLADLLLLLPLALERGGAANFEMWESALPEYEEPSLRISDISGPMIDGEAAFDSKKEEVRCTVPIEGSACRDMPSQIWVLMLVAYIFLLVFNLSYGSSKDRKVRWVWESLYTAFFLVLWLRYDRCGGRIWFSLYLLKFGIFIYLAYLYCRTKREK